MLNEISKLIVGLSMASLFVFFILGVVYVFHPHNIITQEQIQQNARKVYLSWYQNEVKYCQSKNMEFNETFVINNCQMITCFNESQKDTFQICDIENHDSGGSFVGGLIVGHLLS